MTEPDEWGPSDEERASSRVPPDSGVRAKRGRKDSITISAEALMHLMRRPLDQTLLAGAENALEHALGLAPGNELLLLLEAGQDPIGTALVRACERLGISVRAYIVSLEQSSSPAFRERLRPHLDAAHASILVGTQGGLDPAFRHEVCTRQGERRHGHMVGVTDEMMRQSMRADWAEVHRLGDAILDCVRGGREFRVSSSPRDLLRIEPDRNCRWHNGSGLLRDPGFTNLPGGEVSTSPLSVSGTFRVDGGAFLPDGQVIRTPVRLRFERGELVSAEGHGAEAILRAADAHPMGRRVGQIALGTNTSVLTPIGAMLQDLKMPGFHLVLGYSCPELTGATWTSRVMLPLACRRPDVYVDDDPLMVRGRYRTF